MNGNLSLKALAIRVLERSKVLDAVGTTSNGFNAAFPIDSDSADIAAEQPLPPIGSPQRAVMDTRHAEMVAGLIHQATSGWGSRRK